MARFSALAALVGELGRPRESPLRARELALLLIILLSGPVYGAAMGTFGLALNERLLMVVYAAVKVPVLLLLTAAICLPGFFVINTVVGLRADFAAALRAILAGQAALALSLASLAPLTMLVYLSGATHRVALLCNAVAFFAATIIAQVVIRRHYRPLIARASRHRTMLVAWVVLYAFVGVQLGWMLRPFVGTPGVPVTFVRAEPFSNAYVVVFRLIVPRAANR